MLLRAINRYKHDINTWLTSEKILLEYYKLGRIIDLQ